MSVAHPIFHRIFHGFQYVSNFNYFYPTKTKIFNKKNGNEIESNRWNKQRLWNSSALLLPVAQLSLKILCVYAYMFMFYTSYTCRTRYIIKTMLNNFDQVTNGLHFKIIICMILKIFTMNTAKNYTKIKTIVPQCVFWCLVREPCWLNPLL